MKNLSFLSYLYLFIYFFCLLILFTIRNLVFIWIIIELIIFMFIGLVFKDSVVTSSFMFYFIIQSLSSVIIIFALTTLAFYEGLCLVFYFFVIIKIAIFPFFVWYYNIIKTFPPLTFFLVLSPQKLPVLWLIYIFNNSFLNSLNYSMSFLILFLVFRLFFSSLGGLLVSDVKRVLIWSSLVNSVWMVLSTLRRFIVLLVYFLLYSFILFLVIAYSGWFSNRSVNRLQLVWLMFIFIGFPPFPLFFAKLYLVLQIFSTMVTRFNVMFLLIILLLRVVSIVIYFRVIIGILVK